MELKKKKIKWITLCNQILDNKAKQKPVMFEDSLFDFQIFGFEKTRMGFMIIWEVSTNRATNVCRMTIPEGIGFNLMDKFNGQR